MCHCHLLCANLMGGVRVKEHGPRFLGYCMRRIPFPSAVGVALCLVCGGVSVYLDHSCQLVPLSF